MVLCVNSLLTPLLVQSMGQPLDLDSFNVGKLRFPSPGIAYGEIFKKKKKSLLTSNSSPNVLVIKVPATKKKTNTPKKP